jgi:pimeloyl-ACP methyl ester carboxylesterase
MSGKRNLRVALHSVAVVMALAVSAIGTTGAQAQTTEGVDCSVPELADFPAVMVQAERFTVEVRGSGPDLLLIPGMGTPRAVWDATVKSFAGCYRIHTVQLRGFGDAAGANATGPVLEPFAAGLSGYVSEVTTASGKPLAVVGHSMGGLVGLKLALAQPKQISRLMVVDGLPSFAVTIPGLATADPATVPATIERVASQMRTVILSRHGKAPEAADIDASVAGMSINPAAITVMKQWSQTADARVVAQAVYDNLRTDMRPQLAGITTPVSVLAAWHSGMPFTEPQVQAFFQRQFSGLSNVTVRTVSGSAHFIMLDQPETFHAALTAFLQGARAAT